MESALRPPLPTATQALAELQIQPWLDQRLRAKHHRTDPRKQTPGGRHQIGTPAGFKSESVAGFLLECLAGFVGNRNRFLRGAKAAVIGAMGGRKVMGLRRLAGEEEALFEGKGQVFPCCRMPRKRMAVGSSGMCH